MARTDGSAWFDGEDSDPFCTSSARRHLRADAGSRHDDGEEDEGDEGGLMASLFAMMYIPYGFRVVCEWP